VPSPGIVGKVRPPVDEVGVGVELVLDPPQPAIPTIAPMEMAPTRSDLMVMRFLVVVGQCSAALNRRR
jgi:hypothetical protein